MNNRSMGFSWGVKYFRIGRSQTGRWWISIRMPLGFRIKKSLNHLKPSNSKRVIVQKEVIKSSVLDDKHQEKDHEKTNNEKILDNIKALKK
ncbi:hypothetical protein [Alteromonas macleodii]|uniref:hypothetical protein n=1 Tax=Alteromonas macleodii TaxID=28108 RepID=UPI002076AE84|nr:hypothetical protein [Alteromonas macleodii]USI27900.1 hypothetical protein NFG60_19685 [Alteromonas macleodii]